MILSTFNLWLFPEKSHISINKNNHFLAYKKQPLLCDKLPLSKTTIAI